MQNKSIQWIDKDGNFDCCDLMNIFYMKLQNLGKEYCKVYILLSILYLLYYIFYYIKLVYLENLRKVDFFSILKSGIFKNMFLKI